MAKGEEGEPLGAKRGGRHNALERRRIRAVNKTRRVILRVNFLQALLAGSKRCAGWDLV